MSSSEMVRDEKALLSVREVSRLLGCSDRHLYRLVSNGAFPKPIKFGGLTKWSRQTIDAFVTGGCQVTQEVK